MSKIRNHTVLVWVLAFVLASAAVGCGSTNEASHAETSAAHERDHAREYAVDHLKTRLNSAVRLPPFYRSADELLTNVRFAEGNDQPRPLTDAVVVGRISSVTPGLGFADPASGVEGEPMGDGIQVPFDSPDALWRTVHLTVEVDEVLSGDIAKEMKEIRVGLAIGNTNTDEEQIRDGLEALGRVVWFLWKGSPVFAYDPSLYSVLEDGRLIAQLTADDRLVFPMLEEGDPSATALSSTTLAELRNASEQPGRTVRVRLDVDRGTWTR